MKTSTILKKAKALIADERHHIGGDGLPFFDGRTHNAERKLRDGSCAYCLLGAHWAVGGGWESGERLLREAAKDLFDAPTVAQANDRLGFDAVHIILDEAIKRAKAVRD